MNDKKPIKAQHEKPYYPEKGIRLSLTTAYASLAAPFYIGDCGRCFIPPLSHSAPLSLSLCFFFYSGFFFFLTCIRSVFLISLCYLLLLLVVQILGLITFFWLPCIAYDFRVWMCLVQRSRIKRWNKFRFVLFYFRWIPWKLFLLLVLLCLTLFIAGLFSVFLDLKYFFLVLHSKILLKFVYVIYCVYFIIEVFLFFFLIQS